MCFWLTAESVLTVMVSERKQGPVTLPSTERQPAMLQLHKRGFSEESRIHHVILFVLTVATECSSTVWATLFQLLTWCHCQQRKTIDCLRSAMWSPLHWCLTELFTARLSLAKAKLRHKLQALVYDIFPSTTAVFSYAIGSRKLSDNEQFFCWCSNSSRFVTNNSDYMRRLFYN